MIRLRFACVLSVVACGWSTPEPAPSPNALLAGAHELAADARGALARCQNEVVARLDQPGLTLEDVGRSCGPVRELFDAQYPAGIGRTRATDQLLGELARVAEDVDYLEREFERGRHLASAKEHLQRSVRDCDKIAVTVAAREGVSPVAGRPSAEPGVWERTVSNGRHDYGGLMGYAQRYAHGQGLDADSVRDRILRHFARAADARLVGLEAQARMGEMSDAKRRYVETTRELVRVYDKLVEAYATGTVRSQELREALWTEMQGADERWRATWASADGDGPQGGDDGAGGEH